MKDCLELTCRDTRLSIPNAWEQLSEGLFVRLTAHLAEMQAGQLSPGEVGVRFVCDALGCDWRRLRNEDAIANLVCIAERLTFIFRIEYPDNNAILAHLPKAERHLCLHTDPFRLQLPIARKLRTMNYRYALDLCFCAQLIPKVTVQGHEHAGYTVNTAYGSLTCSLTALQYIERAPCWPPMATHCRCWPPSSTSPAHTTLKGRTLWPRLLPRCLTPCWRPLH